MDLLCLTEQNLIACKTQGQVVCSKLTTLLVNIFWKFQKLIYKIIKHFLLKKYEKLLQCTVKFLAMQKLRNAKFCNAIASLIFTTKTISVFGYKVVKHLMS